MPLPSEETTPPVMNTYRVMGAPYPRLGGEAFHAPTSGKPVRAGGCGAPCGKAALADGAGADGAGWSLPALPVGRRGCRVRSRGRRGRDTAPGARGRAAPGRRAGAGGVAGAHERDDRPPGRGVEIECCPP